MAIWTRFHRCHVVDITFEGGDVLCNNSLVAGVFVQQPNRLRGNRRMVNHIRLSGTPVSLCFSPVDKLLAMTGRLGGNASHKVLCWTARRSAAVRLACPASTLNKRRQYRATERLFLQWPARHCVQHDSVNDSMTHGVRRQGRELTNPVQPTRSLVGQSDSIECMLLRSERRTLS